MPKGEIQVAIKKIKDIKKGLASVEGLSKEVIEKTIKDTTSRAPAQVTKSVTEYYTIKAGEVKTAGKTMKGKAAGKIKIAGADVTSMSLVYSGRPLTLTHFRMTPKSRPEGNKKYTVKAEIVKGEKLSYPRAFLGTSGSAGTVQIPFQRKGKERLPIETIKRTSIPQMIDNEERPVRENISARIEELMQKRLEHQITQAQKKIDKFKKSL